MTVPFWGSAGRSFPRGAWRPLHSEALRCEVVQMITRKISEFVKVASMVRMVYEVNLVKLSSNKTL